MDKKKKIILITLIVIIALLVIIGIILSVTSKNNSTTTEEKQVNNTNILSLSNQLQEKSAFTINLVKDDNNEMYYAKQNNEAYIDTIYNGKESKYIIKDGNTYLLLDDSKMYYTYSNNQVNLNKIENTLNKIKELEYQEGKEEVNGKNYNYIEYLTSTDFTLDDFSKDKNVKTRFYFDNNDNLVYIRTISDEKEELLSFEFSDGVDSNLFEIPSDYTEG